MKYYIVAGEVDVMQRSKAFFGFFDNTASAANLPAVEKNKFTPKLLATNYLKRDNRKIFDSLGDAKTEVEQAAERHGYDDRYIKAPVIYEVTVKNDAQYSNHYEITSFDKAYIYTQDDNRYEINLDISAENLANGTLSAGSMIHTIKKDEVISTPPQVSGPR